MGGPPMSEELSRRGFLKWQVFVDKLSGNRVDPHAAGPRRRESERYPYGIEVRARCASWPKGVDVVTGDVSDGGLYVPVDAPAKVGEAIELEFSLPDGEVLYLVGAVARVVGAQQAAAENRSPGVGVRLGSLSGEDMVRFGRILDAARSSIPRPPKPLLAPAGAFRFSAINATAPATATTLSEEDFAAADAEVEAALPAPAVAVGSAAAAMRSGDNPILGIDLGTRFTSMAVATERTVLPLPWPHGVAAWPSVVWFPSADEHVVGTEADSKLASDPEHTVASPMHVLGREYDDPEIQEFIRCAAYRTLRGPDDWVVAEIWERQYTISELCSLLLQDAQRAAEKALDRAVRQCVLSVPISFDEECTGALLRAAELSGLEILSLIDEPSAVALANRFDIGFGGVIGIYDLGGCCFDFSIVDVTRGDFAVLSTAGETNLGGGDIDRVLAEAAAERFRRAHGIDLRDQAFEWRRLLLACERAKCVLSVDEAASIYVPEVPIGTGEKLDLNMRLDRATFEKACSPLIARSLAASDQALDLLGMKPEALSAIFLSGGSAYVPAVRQAIADHFHRPVRTDVPPEHAVSLGAAIRAAQLR